MFLTRHRKWYHTLRYWLLIYGVLLWASHTVRNTSAPLPLEPGQQSVVLRWDDQEASRVAYWDIQPDAPGMPVLLLHGTPMASSTFDNLRPHLKNRRLIIPDLPGFGRSERRQKNYSVRSHAAAIAALLQHLEIKQAHVVGYSQSGGVALELINQNPDTVGSLTMLSAIGVQELELLGDYFLNHGLYLMQWAGLWGLHNAFPHFGLLDNSLLSVEYARNFLDTDQRPLRGMLQSYDGPALILHGQQDVLIPVEAAKEHARLMPQSRLLISEGGHGLVFHPPTEVLQALHSFWADAEQGRAGTRATADPQKVEASKKPFDPQDVLKPQGLMLVMIFFLLAISTYGSEDLTCVAAGLMVANGNLPFIVAVLACGLGIFTGDILLYLAGRHIGSRIVSHAPFKWMIKPEDIKRSRSWFRRHGPKAVMLSRFVPGMRIATYVSAGIAHMPLKTFCGYFLIAVTAWTPFIIGLAIVVGRPLLHTLEQYQRFSLWIVLGIILGVLLLRNLILPACTWKGRRLLLSAWRRRTRWEFWPMWAFYPRVLIHLVRLSLKHRGLTCTAVNPAMPASGVIGESKSAILAGLNSPWTARYCTLDPAEGPATAESFMQQQQLNFPVVLKPDLGQRGEGVEIIHSEEQLIESLERRNGKTLIQAFAPGHEFGVFYYRYPHETQGRIFAVTDKRFTSVVGDGQSTLETLILADDRAVCMAPLYFDLNADRLYDVPAAGEAVQLVELGTHCRGALFKNGAALITPELSARIDEISRGYPGFYFGRYDIRTPDLEDFKRGENFKILELNGVTAEATSIYDPDNSLSSAYQTLFEQWNHAFAIGAANHKRGAPLTSLWQLIKAWRAFEPEAE